MTPEPCLYLAAGPLGGSERPFEVKSLDGPTVQLDLSF